MGFPRYLILAAVLTVMCGMTGLAARAATVDPKIGLGGTGSCGDGFTQESTTQEFTIGADQFNCINDFTNETGSTILSLTITVDPSTFAGTLNCFIDTARESSSPFNTATTSDNSVCSFFNSFEFFAAEVGGSGGISNGSSYGVQFGYPDAPFLDANGDQLQSLTFDVSAVTATPEPGTMLMLGTGLLALARRRKKLEVATDSAT